MLTVRRAGSSARERPDAAAPRSAGARRGLENTFGKRMAMIGRCGFWPPSRYMVTWNSICASVAVMVSVIIRDPEILGGRPVFRGTRVPVEVLFENLEDGLSIDEIIEAYPSLNKQDVIACLEGACASLKAA
jgi:uncharacterized protein (DUF433 family)